MRLAANIAGGLLGFIFVVLPSLILLGVIKTPPPVPDSAQDYFLKAMVPSGWIYVIQGLEIIGGILVAIPKTRNFGLLVLGPIIINILCFHVLLMKGEGLMGPPLLVALLAAFLLFVERKAFAALLH